MDVLRVTGMKFHAFHGHNEQEKIDGNDFEVDLILHFDMTLPGNSDKLDDALDYADLRRITAGIMEGPSADLIEYLAFKIGNTIWDTYGSGLNPPIDGHTNHVEAGYSWPR